MTDWKRYAREMAEAKERAAAFERTLEPGELAELDQTKAVLYQVLSEYRPEESGESER